MPRKVRSLATDHLMRFPGATRPDPAVEHWLNLHADALGDLAREWFDVVRACGDDVRELIHDGRPTACVHDAAFVYVDAYTAHVNVGFFRGTDLLDPEGLLQGTGRFMKHVKLKPDEDVNRAALRALIQAAYADMRRRV